MRGLHRSPFLPLALPVAAGLALGLFAPSLAAQMEPLGEAFIRLLGWLTYPLVFCMLAAGVAALGRDREQGRTGAYALIYFAAMSLLSLLAGLAAGWALEPGAGASLATGAAPASSAAPLQAGMLDWLDRLPPLRANNLPLLAAALPAGLLLGRLPHTGALALVERCRARLFQAIKAVLQLAPLAAFGAMAATVAHHGLVSLLPLLKFIAAINLASLLFVLVVLGGMARLAGLPLLRFLAYVRAELYLVFFTSSSLAGLAPLSEKLERLGCPRAVTGVVLPFSYSLNLAGTYLYIALALMFLAQAARVHLGWHELVLMLGVALVSSKGAVGVAGSGIATLAATVALLHVAPPEMVAILFAVDRTMKCRLLTNVIGHGVACVVVAAWEGSLDRAALEYRMYSERFVLPQKEPS
ncbi:cation:dicarboxylate symporter family transporter [Massilia sp. LXY-6]|uniref:cation:dicarboxylate symporter family transporter n=1 Tax=Massilia sp. LXY-6 TaxID=3379823 RepID=UPI003EE2A01B